MDGRLARQRCRWIEHDASAEAVVGGNERGGLETVAAVAKEKGVHLLLAEADKGNELVAASTKPFAVIC